MLNARKGINRLTHDQVIAHMPGTLNELAAKLGVGRSAVRSRLKELRGQSKLYVSGWVRPQNGHGPYIAVWSYGEGPDVPGPTDPNFVPPTVYTEVGTAETFGREPGAGSLRRTNKFINEVCNRWPQGPFAALFNYNEVKL